VALLRAARPSRSVAFASGKRSPEKKKAARKGKGRKKKKNDKVRILFTTEYSCADGEKLLLVGEHKVLGAWNPIDGVSLQNASASGRADVWQASVLLEKGHSYQFKFLTLTHGKHIRWQEGSNRLINIPTEVPSRCGFGAHVPWEGVTSVTSDSESQTKASAGARNDDKEEKESSSQKTKEVETLDLLTSIQEAVVDPKQALYLTSALKKEMLSEEESILEAHSKAVDSAVSDLDRTIDEAQGSLDDDPTSLDSLAQDIQVAAASRRVVISMQLMQEEELKKQLTAGKTQEEVVEEGLGELLLE
jgi:hypothetical protein